MNRDNEQYRDIAVKSLAVLGLMTILALGSFLTLTALSYVPKIVRSVGTFVSSTTPNVGTAVVNVVRDSRESDYGLRASNSSIPSGSSVVVSWNKTSAEAGGSYTISFPCVSGVTVSYKGQALHCNVPYHVDQDARDMTLSVTSKKGSSAEVPVTLRFTKNGEDRSSGYDTFALSVNNGSVATNEPQTPTGSSSGSGAAKPKPTVTYTAPKPKVVTYVPPLFSSVGTYIPGVPSYFSSVFLPTPAPTTVVVNNPSLSWGEADLRPVVLEFGILDPNTKAIIPTRFMSRTNKAAIRFAIENIGTKTSAPWVFNAVLPTSPKFTYLPEFQPPLKPGERIEYTLSFDRVVNDNNTVVITIDPAGTLPEAFKGNNTASVDFIAF